ncbi:MAG TPA: NlpC/P60 family protein [Candidatus Limnocylindrales bacterium]
MTFAAIGAAAFLISLAPAPAAAAEPVAGSAALAVVRAAESHLGARYQYGATGPHAFDCSGLVYRVFTDVGLRSRIAGLHSATGLYRYFSSRHLASRTAPQLGDLVIWGNGAHVGIYIGNGRAISALTSGVRIHNVSAVLSGFTTYLHTHLTATHAVAPPPAHPGPATSAATPRTRHVAIAATLRTAAGTTHQRLALLRNGVRLTVIGSTHLSNHRLWLHVRTAGGRTGWVAGWLTRA